MASITKTARGFRAQVCVMGTRDSQVFRTKREADAWAASRETEIRNGHNALPGKKYSLKDAMLEYGKKVSPRKDGTRWELIRLDHFSRMPFLPSDKPIADITPNDLSEFRDARLKTVKPGTVLREFSLLSSVFQAAVDEWEWIDRNPCSKVVGPPAPKHRDVTIKRHQIHKMLQAMKYRPSEPVKTMTHAVAICFLVALRTGMRAQELCNLKWVDVHSGYCVLHKTKTDPRDVPLTPKAERLIGRLKNFDSEYVFNISTQTLDALFRKYRNKSHLEGFTFHDSRHTAATWIAARMKSDGMPAQQAVFDLCKMFGWKNINQALVYYNPSAADIAKRIS